jgi:hypothetical protein
MYMQNRKILFSLVLVIVLAGIAFAIVNSRTNISSDQLFNPSHGPIALPPSVPLSNSPIINPSHGPIAFPPPIPLANPAPTPATSGGCFTVGCSGQICTDQRVLKGAITTCEFRPEYACYRITKCERQPGGACGWTPTPQFTACINNLPNSNLLN